MLGEFHRDMPFDCYGIKMQFQDADHRNPLPPVEYGGRVLVSVSCVQDKGGVLSDVRDSEKEEKQAIRRDPRLWPS